MTTATAVTSNGVAGSGRPLDLAEQRPAAGHAARRSPLFSNPLLFNNIFWDNRAGTGRRHGDRPRPRRRRHPDQPLGPGGRRRQRAALADDSVLQTDDRAPSPSPTNVDVRPAVVDRYDTSVAFAPWRTNPDFIGAILVAVDLPPNLMGDYHLTSDARRPSTRGAATKSGVRAPADRHRRRRAAGRRRVRHGRRRVRSAGARQAPAPAAPWLALPDDRRSSTPSTGPTRPAWEATGAGGNHRRGIHPGQRQPGPDALRARAGRLERRRRRSARSQEAAFTFTQTRPQPRTAASLPEATNGGGARSPGDLRPGPLQTAVAGRCSVRIDVQRRRRSDVTSIGRSSRRRPARRGDTLTAVVNADGVGGRLA